MGLTSAAASGTGNLLDLAVKAARVKATVGEISEALEKGLRFATVRKRAPFQAFTARRSGRWTRKRAV